MVYSLQYQLKLAKLALVKMLAWRLKSSETENSLLQPWMPAIAELGEAVSICTHLVVPKLGFFVL